MTWDQISVFSLPGTSQSLSCADDTIILVAEQSGCTDGCEEGSWWLDRGLVQAKLARLLEGTLSLKEIHASIAALAGEPRRSGSSLCAKGAKPQLQSMLLKRLEQMEQPGEASSTQRGSSKAASTELLLPQCSGAPKSFTSKHCPASRSRAALPSQPLASCPGFAPKRSREALDELQDDTASPAHPVPGKRSRAAGGLALSAECRDLHSGSGTSPKQPSPVPSPAPSPGPSPSPRPRKMAGRGAAPRGEQSRAATLKHKVPLPALPELQQLLGWQHTRWSSAGTRVECVSYQSRLLPVSTGLPDGGSVQAVLDARAGPEGRELCVSATVPASVRSRSRPVPRLLWLPEALALALPCPHPLPRAVPPQESLPEEQSLQGLQECTKLQQALAAGHGESPSWRGSPERSWPVLEDFCLLDAASRLPAMLWRVYPGELALTCARDACLFSTVHAEGRLPGGRLVQSGELIRWGVTLADPGHATAQRMQLYTPPQVWVETRRIRYVLGAPSQAYAPLWQALLLQATAAQVLFNYSHFNPHSDPAFAMQDLASHKYQDQERPFDAGFLRQCTGFVVWVLQSNELPAKAWGTPLLAELGSAAGGAHSSTGAQSARQCRRASSNELHDSAITLKRCLVCGSKEQPAAMLLCDGCDHGFHAQCLQPRIDRAQFWQLTKGAAEWFCAACSKEPMPPPPQCCPLAPFLKGAVLEGLRPRVSWDLMPKNCMAGMDDNQYGELTLQGTCQLLCLLAQLGEALGPGDSFLDLGSGLGQVALRVAILTGANVVGIESSSYCTEFAEQWAARAKQEGLMSQFDLSGNVCQVLMVAESFLEQSMRVHFEEATVIFVNNFVFTHKTNVAVAERILGWCREGCVLLVAKDLPKPIEQHALALDFLGVYQLPCGCADWTDNAVLCVSAYRVVRGRGRQRRRVQAPQSLRCSGHG